MGAPCYSTKFRMMHLRSFDSTINTYLCNPIDAILCYPGSVPSSERKAFVPCVTSTRPWSSVADGSQKRNKEKKKAPLGYDDSRRTPPVS